MVQIQIISQTWGETSQKIATIASVRVIVAELQAALEAKDATISQLRVSSSQLEDANLEKEESLGCCLLNHAQQDACTRYIWQLAQGVLLSCVVSSALLCGMIALKNG